MASFRISRSLLAQRVTILMLHRFSDRQANPGFHSLNSLRATLELLRRRRFDLLSIADLVTNLRDGIPLARHSIAFTVDDGYADFSGLAADVFLQFDCPVTVYIATGFVDRRYWFWWDRVEVAFRQTPRSEVSLSMGTEALTYRLHSSSERGFAIIDLISRLKRVTEATKEALLQSLPTELDVDLPQVAPDDYAPMTWDEIRSLQGRGVAFGPHTVSHPILAQVSAPQMLYEVNESRDRLNAELGRAGPAFCYPNGDSSSFGAREVQAIRSSGFTAALSALPDYVPSGLGCWEESRWSLPRFHCPDRPGRVLALVTGVQRY